MNNPRIPLGRNARMAAEWPNLIAELAHWKARAEKAEATLAGAQKRISELNLAASELSRESGLLRAEAAVLRRALESAAAHIEELADAWRRGCIRESDGLGGTCSNRNWDVHIAIREALRIDAGTKLLANYRALLEAAQPFVDLGCKVLGTSVEGFGYVTAQSVVDVSVISSTCGYQVGLLKVGDLRRLAEAAGKGKS